MRVVTNFTSDCRGFLCADPGPVPPAPPQAEAPPLPRKVMRPRASTDPRPSIPPARCGTPQISDAIPARFTVNGLPVTVTVDIASSALEKLTLDQWTALKENLHTLGFQDWNVE